jgi:flagellar biosynthesis/type III secretory pathway protein FliH
LKHSRDYSAASHVCIQLVQSRQQKLSKQGEMQAMKVWCYAPREQVLQSERLSAFVVPQDEVSHSNAELVVAVPDDALGIESIAQALQWQTLSSTEQKVSFGHVSWQTMCGLLQAAAWLGCMPLLSVCESRLMDLLCLDNVVPVARAAERSNALRLLTTAFFLLKAYFCADTDSLERPIRTTANALPRLGLQGIRQGSYAFPHHGWRDVVRSCRARSAGVRNAQPCYTLCTLTRERSPGRPSVFRLVSEHDGKLLLVARQRYAGEGDFLIFGVPEEDDRREQETREKAEAANREEEEREEAAEQRDLEELRKRYPDGDASDAPDEDDDEEEEKAAPPGASAAGGEGAGGEGAGGEGASGEAIGGDGSAGGDGEPASQTASQPAAAAAEPTPAQRAARERRDRRKQRERERKERVEKIAALEAELRQARADAFVESIASAHAEALPEHSACFRGCLSSRWLGLHFSLYDSGLRSEQIAKGFPFPPRQELAAVAYASNLLKSRPHSMTVVVRDTELSSAQGGEDPSPIVDGSPAGGDEATATRDRFADGTGGADEAASPAAAPAAAAPAAAPAAAGGGGGVNGEGVRKPRSTSGRLVSELTGDIDTTSMRTAAASFIGGGSGSLLERKMNGKTEGLSVLHNQMPDWDPKLEAFTLPFYQRVSLPSKKNVHIVNPQAPDDIVLLFGKRAKSEDGMLTTFSLDYCRPVSCLAAFATALTAFFGSE